MPLSPDPLTVPRRIAFVGDWHANRSWALRAIAHAVEGGNADAILHLGDYGYTFERPFTRAVETALSACGVPLLFVDGNHEHHPRLLRYPTGGDGLRQVTDHVWHLPRGFRWEWAGVRFLALGGAHSVDRSYRTPGVSWWPEETIGPVQARRSIERGPADVLLSHDCPAGVTIPGVDDRTTPSPFPLEEIQRAHEHRQVLRTVVDAVQPRQIWHGHYHVDYTAEADFGYGPVRVTGLDCDETTLERNVRLVDLADLAAAVAG